MDKRTFDRKEWARAIVAEAVKRDAIPHLWAAVRAHFRRTA